MQLLQDTLLNVVHLQGKLLQAIFEVLYEQTDFTLTGMKQCSY